MMQRVSYFVTYSKCHIFVPIQRRITLRLLWAGTACWGEALAKTNAPPYENSNVGPVTGRR